jgi:hypothetical protein
VLFLEAHLDGELPVIGIEWDRDDGMFGDMADGVILSGDHRRNSAPE